MLETKLTKAVALIDDQQQYSRRNCLLFHGVKEESSEDTDNIVTKICAEKLRLEVDKSMIDGSHRIGPKNKDQKPRPIIVNSVATEIEAKYSATRRCPKVVEIP